MLNLNRLVTSATVAALALSTAFVTLPAQKANAQIGIKAAAGTESNWQPNGPNSVYLDVDTSAAGFTGNPVYVTSLSCDDRCFATTGGSSIYSPTPTGFRIFVRFTDDSPLTPAIANGFTWVINWTGLGQ